VNVLRKRVVGGSSSILLGLGEKIAPSAESPGGVVFACSIEPYGELFLGGSFLTRF